MESLFVPELVKMAAESRKAKFIPEIVSAYKVARILMLAYFRLINW